MSGLVDTFFIMNSQLIAFANGEVQSSEGWALRPLTPELMEYVEGSDACLVNVGAPSALQVRMIYATESLSDLFPRLRENVTSALPFLNGRYVVA